MLRAARETSLMRFLISSCDHSDIPMTPARKNTVLIRNALRTSATCCSTFVASTLSSLLRTIAIWIVTSTRSTTTASAIRTRVEESLPPTRISGLSELGTDTGTTGPFTPRLRPDRSADAHRALAAGRPLSAGTGLGIGVEQALDRGDLVLERLLAVAALVELEDRVDARETELERHGVQLADEREDVGRLALERRAHRVQDVADAVLSGQAALDLGDVAAGGRLGTPQPDDGEVRGRHAAGGYQAWPVPQCGQATVVDTAASKAKPQAHR